MKMLNVIVLMLIALTIPSSSVYAERNFLQESGWQFPNYKYSLLLTLPLQGSMSGVIELGRIGISYHSDNCYTAAELVEGKTCYSNITIYHFDIFNAPVCNSYADQGIAPNCRQFLVFIEANGFGWNGQPVPGVSCCSVGIISGSSHWTNDAYNSVLYVYLATKT